MTNNLPLAGATFFALTLTACDADVEADAPAPSGDARTLEIIENLERAGYPEQEITFDEHGQVIVGGDAVVTLEASREMIGLTRNGDPIEDREDPFRQYRTSNVIDSAIDKICINGSALIGHATFSPALDAAIANYNTQNLTFDMTRIAAPTGVGCDAVITVGLVGGATSSAGFPVGGLPYNTVSLASGTAGYGLAASTHTITHELGHCIGFRHADYYNRSISCGTGGNEGSAGVGAIHIPNTPTAAVNNGSIMNSCYGGGSTGVWTAEDIDALHQLYGRDCCAVGTGAGCGNVPVNECVGAFDPYCNDTQWDNLCVTEIATLSCGACPDLDHSCCSTGGAGCSDNFIEAAVCVGTLQSCCTAAWGQSCVAKVNELADSVGLPCDSTCCAPKDTAGCNSPSVQACVAAADPWCVNVKWDALCVDEVESLGCGHCP